ncbi:MAG: PQ-loop repeat-containing protein [Alphaproteobacteria bacterium]|nr:PQ-loop repeat-containing protein [Alphaproteobacteria bacterium]
MNVIIALALISIVTILEVFAYIPQIIKLIKTKSAEDISLTSWLTWMVSDICYLAYVLLESPEAGVIFLASLSLFLVMFVFILTMYYQKSKKLRKEHC